jgi:hypothetical protein
VPEPALVESPFSADFLRLASGWRGAVVGFS